MCVVVVVAVCLSIDVCKYVVSLSRLLRLLRLAVARVAAFCLCCCYCFVENDNDDDVWLCY